MAFSFEPPLEFNSLYFNAFVAISHGGYRWSSISILIDSIELVVPSFFLDYQ